MPLQAENPVNITINAANFFYSMMFVPPNMPTVMFQRCAVSGLDWIVDPTEGSYKTAKVHDLLTVQDDLFAMLNGMFSKDFKRLFITSRIASKRLVISVLAITAVPGEEEHIANLDQFIATSSNAQVIVAMLDRIHGIVSDFNETRKLV